MKWAIKLVFVSVVLLMAFAKPDKTDKVSPDIRIKQMLDSLPSGWYGVYNDSGITFHCKDSVYRIFTNHINEEARFGKKELTEEEKMENFRKKGKMKVHPFLSFRWEKKWTDAQIKKANSTNQKIYKQIKSLAKKHNIDHLYDNYASHKGEPTYTPRTDEDKRNIALYEYDKRQLEKNIVKFPDYCSFNYSIFVLKRVGMNDAYEDIYPEKVSQQAYHIMNVVSEVWDCNAK